MKFERKNTIEGREVYESMDFKTTDSEIIKIIRNSIYHKPEKHFFNIKEKAYVQDRFMNTTGG